MSARITSRFLRVGNDVVAVRDARSSPESEPTELSAAERRPSRALGRGAAVAVLVLSLTGLRGVFLEADTPTTLPTASMAIHVDEGYKTFAARNLVLYGEPRWHPLDEYEGWLRGSPLTQGFHYVVFRLGDADLRHARVLALSGTLLMLGAYVVGLRSRYSTGLLLSGAIVLGLSWPLFVYTRIALFEGLLAAIVVCVLAAFARTEAWMPRWQATLLVGAFAAVAMFGIKRSALVYFLPMFLALATERAHVPETREATRRWYWTVAAGVVAVAIALVLTARVWMDRLGGLRLDTVEAALVGPLTLAAPLLLAAGFLCVLHLLLVEGEGILANRYRWQLTCGVVLGPLAFAAFPYNPLRYYVPFLPFFVLVALEWIALRAWKKPLRISRRPWESVAAIALLAWTGICLLAALNSNVLGRLPLRIGNEPGLAPHSLFLVALPVALGAALVVWRFRRWVPQIVWAAAPAILLGLHLLASLGQLALFYARPSFRGVEIARTLDQRLPDGASIGGDWAPFFALGTDLRSLYIRNRKPGIAVLRPDYFVWSGTDADRDTLRGIERHPEIVLGPPLLREKYAEHEVVVYPVRYLDAGDAERAATENQP